MPKRSRTPAPGSRRRVPRCRRPDAGAEPRGEAPQTSIVDGIRLLQRVLATPGAIARWPMYIRNVKQAMRAADPGFDERKHGNLVEILRSVQRDGLVRLDRDRQGVLRVFQGPQLRAAGGSCRTRRPTTPPRLTNRAASKRRSVVRRAGAADVELAAESCRAPPNPLPLRPHTPRLRSQANPRRRLPPPRRAAPPAQGRDGSPPHQDHRGPQAAGARGHSAQEEGQRRPNDSLAPSPRRIPDVRPQWS